MANYYPPVGFHFMVEVQGLNNELDTRFTEVGGLSVEMGSEEVAEGGENRFVQKYPARPKYAELVLKRGLVATDSGIWEWARKCVEELDIEPRDVYVKLLNDDHKPLMTWNIKGAYPTKWSVSDFNASNNAVVVESLQLFYQYFTLLKS